MRMPLSQNCPILYTYTRSGILYTSEIFNYPIRRNVDIDMTIYMREMEI